MKKPWDLLSSEKKQQTIQEIINYFSTELDQDLGIIAADALLDMVMEQVAVDIYNLAVDDVARLTKDKFQELAADIELNLKKN